MKTKTFDSVKLMRTLRDRLGREMAGMSVEGRLRFLRERISSSPLVARLERARRDGNRPSNGGRTRESDSGSASGRDP